MERYNEESYISFARRATQQLELGNIDYQEWSKALLGKTTYADESLRRISIWFTNFLDRLDNEEVLDRDIVEEINNAKADLERERWKLSDEKRELNAKYRWEARSELYQEKIIQAIDRLTPIEVPNINIRDYKRVNTTALIALSDLHAGSTFEVRGMYGEVVNKYNYEIMQARLWKLLADFINDDMVYDDITIAILGDFLENILRISSLTKLQEPVLDTCINLGAFLAEWIAEVQRRTGVPIKVVCVGGNHDTQRILGSKPQFEDENLGKIIVEFLKLRLRDCKDIIVEDYSDAIVENIRGTSILFEHGSDKDLQTTIEYFSNLYNIDIDEVIGGHLHRPESKAVGITDFGDRLVTRIGSICGVDVFAKKIRASARPSAYAALYTNEGKTWSRNYYL